jgi:hypothetical protein
MGQSRQTVGSVKHQPVVAAQLRRQMANFQEIGEQA